MRELHEFTVEGKYDFPFDMLRYDQCWPKSESDSAVIERSTIPRQRRPFRVTLQGIDEPTEARWQSFGWRVTEVRR